MKRMLFVMPCFLVACTGAIGDFGVADSTGAGSSGQASPGGSSTPGGGAGSGTTTTPGKPGVPTGTPGTTPTPTGPVLIGAAAAPLSGMRRLTVREYDNVLRDLIADPTAPSAGVLPEDKRQPFDNDYHAQDPSLALVQGLNVVAREAVNRLLADKPRRDKVVGCTPGGVTDDACFRSFVTRIGRLALRRPLTTEEVGRFAALSALGTEGGDFYLGVSLALNAFLQHGALVYRVERGTPVDKDPTLFKLQGTEIASRLSFFLWGSMPDDALLTAAEKGDLNSPDGVRAAAARMMKDAKAKDMVTRFHAQWLGYETLVSTGDLMSAQQNETAALMDRVLFTDRRPWRELFTYGQTFVNDVLAKHYGLPLPGSATGAWVVPSDARRRGLMGQSSFFAIGGSSFGDTSPTLRGKAIRNKLLCQVIPPPRPASKAMRFKTLRIPRPARTSDMPRTGLAVVRPATA